MDKNKFDGLLALKLVAEKKNFSTAAEIMNVSTSALSQTVKALENRLGVPLLNRTTRSTRLTEAGENFLKEAGPAMDQIILALENIANYSTKPKGLLRINAPKAIYESYLMEKIKGFTAEYPEIDVEVFFQDGITDIVADGFDAGIRLSDILIKDMVAIKLYGPIKFVVCAAPSYLEEYGRPKRPEDLVNHQCLLSKLGNYFYDQWEFERKGKDFKVKVNGNLRLNDSLLVKQSAINGMGLFYSNYDSIKPHLETGELEVVLSQYASKSTGFYMYYPARSQVSPKLRAFIDYIKTK